MTSDRKFREQNMLNSTRNVQAAAAFGLWKTVTGQTLSFFNKHWGIKPTIRNDWEKAVINQLTTYSVGILAKLYMFYSHMLSYLFSIWEM